MASAVDLELQMAWILIDESVRDRKLWCDEERPGGGSIRIKTPKIPWSEDEECMLNERIVRVAYVIKCVLLSAVTVR